MLKLSHLYLLFYWEKLGSMNKKDNCGHFHLKTSNYDADYKNTSLDNNGIYYIF